MTLRWRDNDTPESFQFDDIYYNPDNGLEESLHVFVQGNNLLEKFNATQNLTIAELGFGTGLNFFLTWKLFDKANVSGDKTLHFISVEKFPLSRDDIARALSPWQQEWEGRLDIFLDAYPVDTIGTWSVKLSNIVSLTVYFDNVDAALAHMSGSVDAWYLDGFAPAKNPDMWSDEVFSHMARLSCKDTSFATFTAAGFVKRGLQAVGFDVEKTRGFGRKRERLVGVYRGKETQS